MAHQGVAEDYIPLARNMAKKYTPKGQNYEQSDCLSVAYEALCKAVSIMEPRDTGTASYLWKRIEGALKRHLTAQRTQGFTGLRRSKYAEAILMDTDLVIPEELRGPLTAALNTALSINEPTSFADGEKGSLEETIDPGMPSAEDECIALEKQAYLSQEIQDWLTRWTEREQAYIVEVMMGDKTQTQFCKENKMSDATAKKIQDRVLEEGAESLSYVLYNLEETP